MKKRYRIQKRKMSPDVVEKRIDGKNGAKDTWKVCLAPIGHRDDMIAHQLLPYLEQIEVNNKIKGLF